MTMTTAATTMFGHSAIRRIAFEFQSYCQSKCWMCVLYDCTVAWGGKDQSSLIDTCKKIGVRSICVSVCLCVCLRVFMCKLWTWIRICVKWCCFSLENRLEFVVVSVIIWPCTHILYEFDGLLACIFVWDTQHIYLNWLVLMERMEIFWTTSIYEVKWYKQTKGKIFNIKFDLFSLFRTIQYNILCLCYRLYFCHYFVHTNTPQWLVHIFHRSKFILFSLPS